MSEKGIILKEQRPTPAEPEVTFSGIDDKVFLWTFLAVGLAVGLLLALAVFWL